MSTVLDVQDSPGGSNPEPVDRRLHKMLVAAVVAVIAVVGVGIWLVMDRGDSGPEFDFSTDSACDWFTGENLDQIVASAQQRVGTTLDLVAFAPDASCSSVESIPVWSSSSTVILLAPLDAALAQERWVTQPHTTVPEDFVGHEMLDQSVAYGNLDHYGRPTSGWPPYGMRVDLRVDGHENDVLWFALEIWGPHSVPGIDDLDETELASLGFAVADTMLKDMNWVD